MSEPVLPFSVAALYQFTRFDDCAAIREPLARLCGAEGVRGTLLLAPEGINGTIAGSDAAIAVVLAHIRGLPGCAGLDVKHSRAATMPFHRMKVRIKREIVTMGEPDLDPTDAGEYVAPQDWNALISEPDVVLVDLRLYALIEGGEQVVIEGQNQLRPGGKVEPVGNKLDTRVMPGSSSAYGGEFRTPCVDLEHDEVQDIQRDRDHWRIDVKDLATNHERCVHTRFVFIGAGGYSLALLEKDGRHEEAIRVLGRAVAAVCALMSRDRGGPALTGQILIMPMLDPGLSTCSMRQMNQCPDREKVTSDCAAAYRGYLPHAADRAHPRGAERLEGLRDLSGVAQVLVEQQRRHRHR